MTINQANEFERIIRQQIYKILQEEKLLQGEWHLGKVDGILSRYSLRAFIDGSETSYSIPCNPNIIFTVGDEIWVHFVNGDSKNKFASYKRATGTESIVDVGGGEPTGGDMSKSVYDINNNGVVDRAEKVDWNGIENKPTTFTPLLGETITTAYRGDRGKTAYDHSQAAHAPTDAQKNSDITKTEIEAKLTGVVTSHTHNYEPANSNIQTHIANTANPHSVTKSQVGLSNAENKSSATIRSETTASNVTTALGFTPENPANKGIVSGYAGLDINARVPYTQLPTDIVTQSDLGSAGYGDMTKGVYDTNNNGIVDRASLSDSVEWANVLSKPTIPTSTSQLTNDSNYKTSVIHRGAAPPVDTGVFWQPI
jgi:hypothetical protein